MIVAESSVFRYAEWNQRGLKAVVGYWPCPPTDIHG